MKADNVMSLPAEVQFSVSKATDMILTVGKVYVLKKRFTAVPVQRCRKVCEPCGLLRSGPDPTLLPLTDLHY